MEKRIEFISPEEFALLLKEVKRRKDKELEVAIILGFGSGLRISEIVGYNRKDKKPIPPLTPDKIDLVKHQIRIDDAKGNKWRITPTSPALKPEHVKLLPLKIQRRNLQYKFTNLAKKVLNKKMSIHILRHGFGNYCVNVKKMPLTMVQGFMGHSSIAVTGVYAKANPEEAIKEYWRSIND